MGNEGTRVSHILGFGGIALAVVAIALMIADLGDLDWLESVAWMLGVVMLAWMVTITVHHTRVYDQGSGRNLLIAGWVSIPVIVGLVVVGGLAAGKNPLGSWIVELLESPQAYVMVLGMGLILSSVAILIDGVDHEARELGKVTGTYGWYRHTS
jgi:hypothetical protein